MSVQRVWQGPTDNAGGRVALWLGGSSLVLMYLLFLSLQARNMRLETFVPLCCEGGTTHRYLRLKNHQLSFVRQLKVRYLVPQLLLRQLETRKKG